MEVKNLEAGLFLKKPATKNTYHSNILIGNQEDASSSDKVSSYILIPPDKMKESNKNNDIFKVVTQDLQKLGVIVNEHISVIDGFTVSIDDKTRDVLEKKGYTVFPDEIERFIPLLPSENAEEEEKADKTDELKLEKVEVKKRPELKSPRFATALTNRYRGRGVTMAILDTGLYPHPDFIYPRNRIVGFVDFVNGRALLYDDNGHGTHVTGDGAGNGIASNGLYRGPASEANIVAIKVLDAAGTGRTSNIVKAIDWVIKNKDRLNIRIINMSLGHKVDRRKRKKEPIEMAVKKAVKAGIVVIVAAGNEGPNSGTIASPGVSPYAITVGAIDDNNTPTHRDDRVTDFSSRGPTPDGLSKPDLVAPGEAIIAPTAPVTPAEAMASKFSSLNDTLEWLLSLSDEKLSQLPAHTLLMMGIGEDTVEKIKSSPQRARAELKRLLNLTSRMPVKLGAAYIGLPGTSMATPIVAGVVAQMLEANPELTPKEVKEILISTADKLPRYGPNSQGAGVVDPHEAIQKAIEKKNAKQKIA